MGGSRLISVQRGSAECANRCVTCPSQASIYGRSLSVCVRTWAAEGEETGWRIGVCLLSVRGGCWGVSSPLHVLSGLNLGVNGRFQQFMEASRVPGRVFVPMREARHEWTHSIPRRLTIKARHGRSSPAQGSSSTHQSAPVGRSTVRDALPPSKRASTNESRTGESKIPGHSA